MKILALENLGYTDMTSLQVLANNLLVWQSSCDSKLYPLNSKSICSSTCLCSAYNQAAGAK